MDINIKTSDVILIAAVDSTEQDKELAHLRCDGKNDQNVIQEAVNSVYIERCGEIRGKRIVLLPGNYYISDFPERNPNGKVAIMVGTKSNRFNHIGILISGAERTESTVINVTKECYDKLDENESYSIFGCAEHNCNHHIFKDLYVTVPDDQKKIVCFDGRYMGAIGIRRCKCLCETRGGYLNPKKTLPNEEFVAFMGTYGSNNMWEEKWEFCQAEGFGQGFAVGNEHLFLEKCTALFGRYGFTFNNYESRRGVIAHPMTIMCCIDEANANLWKFAKNKFKQCISSYNMSFEIFPRWMELEGFYATEERPGDYAGHIDYVANYGCDTPNSTQIPFWAKGSGVNFETVNNTHKKICGSIERREYSANIGQEIFDTDLNKKLIYTGSEWIDFLGNKAD